MDNTYDIYRNNTGVTYTSPIFGPIHSRRLGLSLGINLLPGDGKWCTFDCIYCECGLNRYKKPHTTPPTRQTVYTSLENKLIEMSKLGQIPDVLTFAGNGEPTLNPQFPEIIDDVIMLRDKYCPRAKVSVLSNSTQLHRSEIREALMKTDNPILKLDTVDSIYIKLVDRPNSNYDVEKTIELLATMGRKIIIQTMFMKGTLPDNTNIDNTTDAYVIPYIQTLEKINPRQVMIYTIDRPTPVKGIKKASKETLDTIADKIREKLKIDVKVSY